MPKGDCRHRYYDDSWKCEIAINCPYTKDEMEECDDFEEKE